MLLKDLEVGEAYAFHPSYDEAWQNGWARKAYYLGRVVNRGNLPANTPIEWFFGRGAAVKDDPEVLIAIQWDLSGFIGRRDALRVEMASDAWRPGVVGRRQLLCPWRDFEKRIGVLLDVESRYKKLAEEVGTRLHESGVQDFEVLPRGSHEVFEPDKVIVRMRGQGGLVLGRDIPAQAGIEFKALSVLELPK